METFERILCRIGLHKWSKNWNGWRVCLRPGCTVYDSYFGVTGAIRWMLEHYTDEEIERRAKLEIPPVDNLVKIMNTLFIGGIMAAGMWVLIKDVYGEIENPAGAVIRTGMAGVFSIMVWRIVYRKTGAKQ